MALLIGCNAPTAAGTDQQVQQVGATGTTPSTLDTEEAAFVTLINNYREQNGAGHVYAMGKLASS